MCKSFRRQSVVLVSGGHVAWLLEMGRTMKLSVMLVRLVLLLLVVVIWLLFLI